jgi:DNA-binding NarL/FixJ family response regulator
LNKVITIIIADDHTLFIEGLKLLLQQEPGISILDEAHTGKELLRLLDRQHPEVILLDLNMPELNGLEALSFIKKKSSAKIIVLSTYNEGHLVERARMLGAHGYLLKNAAKELLLMTIRQVYDGQECFPMLHSKTTDPFEEQDGFLKQFHLTKREKEILLLIKESRTNQQMSEQLCLSVYTIETHRKNIMQKLGVNSVAALFKFMNENSL